MANGPVQNVSIKINISGKHLQQLQVLAESVQTVTRRVHALQQAIYRLGQGSGAGQNFSSSKLIESLGEIKTAIAAIKDAKFENVSKAIDSLNDVKITNFANAIGLLKGNLDTSLVQQITSFGTAIQAMGTAQGKFNGAMLVKDIKDLMTGLGRLEISANQTQNITNLKDALSGLSVPLNPNTIAALSQLGFALRNIREYAEGKNVLSSLASGIKQFSKLKEVDGLLHNVRKLAAAAQVLNRADALDFTNFTKGLLKVKELNDTVTKDDWSKIGSVVTSVQKAFAPLDKMKLPNLSGLATVVSTLTARDKEGNIAHDMELFGKQVHAAAGHILEAFTPLKQLKMPQLGGIAKNLDTLSTATYNFKNIEAIVKRFKETLGTLHGIQMPNLNNFAKGLNELQKLKTGVSVRGSLGDDIKSLKTDLMGWEHIKVPNLLPFVKGLQELSAGRLDTRQISENLSSIPKKLRWLTGLQVPDLSGFAKGIHELSKPTVDANRAASAIGTAIDTIHTKLAGKEEIKFPSLATFAKGIKEFHILAEAGRTDEENLRKIVAPIKTLITELQGVGKVDLPNLNGIAVAIHKLSTAVPADAGITAAKHITDITAAVKGLDKIQVPDLTKISKAFETLNKSYVNYYTSGVTGKHGSALEHITEDIKKSLDSLKGIQVPSFNNIASAFKSLSDDKMKGLNLLYFRSNIEEIKTAVTSLGEVGKVTLPNLGSIVTAFKTLNKVMTSGGVTDDYGNRVGDNLSRNIHAIKDVVTQLGSVSGTTLPNLSGVAAAFKVLNSSVLREFSDTSTRETTNAIQVNANALKTALEGFKDIKIPTSLSGLTAAFKTLNEATLRGASDLKTKETSTVLQQNLATFKSALEGYDKISVPNLKQLADGLKNIGGMDLPTRGIFGMGGTKLENNIKVLKSALSMLDGYKIPNVAQLAKGITEIANFDIPTSKSFLGIKWGDKLKENIGSFNAAIKDIKGTTVPNAAQLAEGIKILSGEGINGTVAAGHITAVTAAIQGLNKTSVPNLKPFADGLLTLNEIPRRALKETHLKGIFDTIKRAIGEFGEVRLPALDSLAKGVKNLSSESANADVAAKKITALAKAIHGGEGSPGLANVTIPNLNSIANVVGTLGKEVKKAEELTPSKGILSGVVSALKKGEKELEQAAQNKSASGALQTNLKALQDGLAGFNDLRVPSIAHIASAFKILNESILHGGTNVTGGAWKTNISRNIDAIKAEIEKFKGLENIQIPNLKGVADAFKILNESFIRYTFDLGSNKFNSNIGHATDAISDAIKKLQKLGGKDANRIPNLKDVADAFKTLDEAIPKGKTAFDIHRFEGRIQQIKTAISDLQSLGGKDANKIPNLKNISDAFTALDTIPKNVRVGWTGRFRLNIDQIIEAIEDLQKLGGKGAPKIPNLKSIGDAFVALDRIPVPKDNKFTTGNFEENINKIEAVIKRLQALGGKDANKIPNLKNIADAFKVLNESGLWGFNTWKQGAASGEFVSHIDKNLSEITRVITALQQLNKAAEGGKSPTMPNLKNIADAFKILNESPIKNIPLRNADGSWNEKSTEVSNITRNLNAIKEALDTVKLGDVKVPNLKNVADAFKILNETPMLFKAGQDTDLSWGIPTIKVNLKKLKEAFIENDLSAIKVPNLKNVADAFKTLNSIEKLETVPDAQGTSTRVRHYVDEIAKAFQSANETLKDVKLPNIKNVADAFRILNSIEVKEDKNSNFVQNLKKVWEQLRAFKRDTELQDIKFPNLKNIADGFRTLDTVLKSSDKIETGKFDTNFKAVQGAIEELKKFDKLKLPNLKNIADAFKILNGEWLKGTSKFTAGKSEAEFTSNISRNIDVIKEALEKLKSTEVTKLPNLKNIADGFNILGTIPKGMAQDNRVDVFKTNIKTIIDALHDSKDKLEKIKLPNLKNIADGFSILSSGVLSQQGKMELWYNIYEIKNALKELYNISKDTQGKQFKLPNLEGIAKGFKILNETTLQMGETKGGRYLNNLHENVKAIVVALREFENKNFDLPNINNLATGLQKLNNISKISTDLGTNMQTLKDGLEVLRGVQVPKQFKNFADGLHSLQEFSTKATGQLINDKLAQDLTALAKSLGQFTGITLPTNLQGFAKGIEAVAKVNVQDFTRNFNQLMQAMRGLNLDPNTTALDHLTAKLAVCAAGIHAVENKLRQASASFAGFGNSTKPAEDGLTRLQERIKMFLQYRVISNLFNRITNAIQAIPNNIKEFEKSMYNVQSITGATDNTVAKLGVTVKEIASTTKFSAQEVADGMTMIAQAGFTAGQSMQMMQSISNLATGTLSDMKTVVDLVTSAMVVFNIESNDAARVSDVFANAVNKSKLTMDKIKTAFNYVGPVARDANVTFEESAVAMMLLANSGQRASTIGTGLRNVFSTLLSPSKKLTEAAAAVGVSLTDLDPRVNSFKDVISNLGIVVRDSQVALDVFGKRGSTAVLSLTNGIKDYDRLYSAVTKVGSAAEMAAKQQEGLYVRWKNLTDRAQLLAVTIGQSGLTEIISKIVNSISGLIHWLNSLSDSFGGRLFLRTAVLTTALGAVSAAIGALILFGRPLLGMLSQAHIAFSAVWGAILNNIASIKAHIVATRTQTTAVQVNTATWSIWQKIIWATSGALIKSIASLGAVITALRSFASAFAPLLIITAISAAISTFTEAADSLKNSLQEVGQALDRIQNQSKSVTDALEKITKLKPKTEEYANAIKAMMNAIAENKGPVAGAEEEFRALQRAINDTNDGFVDGGKALAAYLRKLKELAAVQAGFAVDTAAKLFKREVPNPYKMSDRAIQELGVTGIMDSFGGGVMYHDLTFEQTQKAIQKVAANVLTPEEIGKNKTEWARLVDIYKSLREYAEAFLEKQKDVGALNYSMTVSQVEKLAAGLGESEHRLQAIVSIYKELQNVESGKIMNSILPSDVQKTTENLSTLVTRDNKDFNPSTDSEKIKEGIQSVQVSYKELHKIVEDTAAAMTEAGKLNKTNIVYSKEDVSTATEILTRYLKLQEYTKQYKEYFEQAMKEASSDSISVERRERLIANIQKERLTVQRQLQEEADKISSTRNVSENVASLTRGVAVHKEYLQEIEVLERRITETRKGYVEEVSRLSGKQAQEKKEQYEYEIAQLEEEKRRRIELATAAYGSLQRLSKPVSAYVEELLKADKKEQKIRDIQLQKELNRIHILEDAHKQSEGRIGLNFEQARAREQEAIAKFTAARLAAIAKMEQDVRVKYSISDNEDQRKEYHDQLKVLNQQREKVVEDGYKRQHDLEQKYMKASMAVAKEAGDKIEKQAKKANEARKHEQEKAMHEIAQLEAKGVITHEEAEKRKAEVSIKYHNELIASYKKQIEDLVKVGAAENIQQIVKLEEEIGKSTHEAIKAARKGIEDQTKAIYEAKTKLEEIQGSQEAVKGAGDFSKEQQKKITEEYAEEIEKKKKLVKEGLDYEVEYTFSSTSKVAEAIRKHYDKIDSIRSKSAEKQETLEKDMVKKQEDYEKKKLDIRQKYNKKELDLANEKQDILDRLEDSGKGSKKTEKKRVSRAKSRIESAGGQIDAATAAEDKQTLEAIANQLKTDVNTLANSSKPKAHRGTIEGAFALRQQILEAQRKIEEKEEERKFQRELEKDKRRLSILKESAEQALIAEDGRHQLAMQHLEQEAEKMREKIRLAQEEVEVYNKAIREGEEILAKRTGIQPQTSQSQQQGQSSGSNEPAPYRVVVDDKGVAHNIPVRKSQALPTNEVGTYQHAVNQAVEGALSVANATVDNYPGLEPAQIEEAKKTLQEMLLSTKKASEEAAASAEEAAVSAGESIEGISEEVATQVKSTFESLNAEVDKFAGYLNTQATNISNAFGSAIEGAVSEDRINLITQKLESSFTNFNGFVDGVFADIVKIPVAMDNEQVKQGVKETKADVDRLVREAYALVVKGKVEDALRKLKEVKTMLDSLQDKVIHVKIDQTGNVPKPHDNKADGGLIYRRLQSRFINTGSGHKDDVPALLMKNEFVHRAAAVKKYGVDFMYKLNNLQIPTSITKMFASGGLVSNAVGAVHKFANGGLIRSTKRKLEELFAGSGVNLNVDNLNITGKMEEAANQFTSPIGLQAMGMLAKNIESGIAKFVVGGPISNAALTSAQIRNISAAYSSSIAKAQASGNAAIAQAMTEERKRLYDLSDELQVILASLNEEYNTEARKLTDEHKQKLKEKKEEYDKNVEEENTSYNEKVESDTKSYEKEDKDYAKSKSERDTNYQESLQELKDSLEKDRLDYEANLLSKQQAVLEREAAIQNFRNQLNSERYPVGSSQHSSASIEELIYAHAEYAKKKYGSDRMYIIDMGGTISQPNLSDEEKKAELQRLKEAIRPLTENQRKSLNDAYTKAYNDKTQHFQHWLKQADNMKATFNEGRGWTAYKNAVARANGELEEIPMEQSIPYYTYLMQHLRSDYTLPMQQAALELQSAMTEDTPDTKVTKEINKLTKEYKEATDEAEESRIESLEERKKNIEERETSHKDKLAELKKDYDDFVAEENKTYQESLAKLKEETETKVEDAKAGNYENIDIVKNNTADIIEYAKTKMRRSVAAARSDKERWLNNIQNAAREQANKNAADALSTANAYVPEYVFSTEPKTGNAMSVAQGLLGGVDIDELLKKLRSGVLKFAKGGLVPLFRGAKAGTDSVLSLLSPHEFVMSAKAVKAFGVNFMNSLNNLKVPAFATGGMVGANTPVSESAIDKIVNKTVYALDLTLNNTHIGELMGEKDTIDSFMTAMNRARMGIA